MGEPPVVGSLKVSTYGRYLLLKVPTDGWYLVIEGVHLWQVSGYLRCPLTEGVWLLKVSTDGMCLVIEGVHLREAYGY